MKRPFVIAGAVLVAVALLSTLSTYAYGRFTAEIALEPSRALSPGSRPTRLDGIVEAASADRAPAESGLILVPENSGALAARVLSLRAAERSLDAMYYIWADDGAGRMLLRELRDAADRGVRVRLLLDDIGADALDALLVALDHHPLAEVRLFNPTRTRENLLRRGAEMALRFASVNRRLHNKAWIADGGLAVVGGRNIGDLYFDLDEDAHFNDLDLVMVGAAARDTQALFDRFWNSGLAYPVSALSDREPQEGSPALDAAHAWPHEASDAAHASFAPDRFHWSRSARLIADPPEKAALDEDVNDMMTERIVPILDSAERSVEIMSPYFVPKEAGTRFFTDLAQRGVEVRILTNSLAATDVAAVHGGYAPHRPALLRGGVELFELRASGTNAAFSLRGSTDAKLHTKAFTVDDRLAFVGSLNFDPRSRSLNTEMGILFEVPELVAQVRRLFATEIRPDHSYRVTLADDARRSLRWTGTDGDGQLAVHDSEPNASWTRRAAAAIMAALPLDSQL